MIDLSKSEQWVAAIAPKPGGFLSIIFSSMVIYQISQTKERFGRLYHRILLAMHINCIMDSIMMFIGTWAIPKGTKNVVGAFGTVASCELQAFIFTQGHAVIVYYASLAIYVYVSIKNNFNVDALKNLEWCFHAVAIFVPLIPNILALVNDIYNPTSFNCWVSRVDPPECASTESYCNFRGSNKTYDVVTLLMIIPFLSCSIVTTVITFLIVHKEGKKSEEDKNLVGKKKFIHEFRKKKSEMIKKQSLIYLFACYLAYGAFALCYILYLMGVNIPFAMLVIGMIPYSFQGVIIGIVHFTVSGQKVQFLGYQVFRSVSLIEVDVNKLKEIEKSAREIKPSSKTSNSTKPPESNRKKVSFSIFHDASESAKWEAFGVYIGSDDDEEDSQDFDHNYDQVTGNTEEGTGKDEIKRSSSFH